MRPSVQGPRFPETAPSKEGVGEGCAAPGVPCWLRGRLRVGPPLSGKGVATVLPQDPPLDACQGLGPLPSPYMKQGPSEQGPHLSLMPEWEVSRPHIWPPCFRASQG